MKCQLSLFHCRLCFSLKRIYLRSSPLYERTNCLCLKGRVLASVITLIRPLFSLNPPPPNQFQFIYFGFKHHWLLSELPSTSKHFSERNKCPILREEEKNKKKLKWNGGRIDYSLPDFCMISPAPLKKHKSEQITPFANERGEWMEYLSRLKRKPVLRFNLWPLGDPRSAAPRGGGDDNSPLLAAASMLASRRRPHRQRLTSTLSNWAANVVKR